MGDPVSIGVLSLASAGLGGVSKVMSAQGTANADTFKAQQLEEAAQYGDLKATQTNAQMTRNLVNTLGNIDAVRAAAHTDPTSPTGAAVREEVSEQATNDKMIKVASIQQQSRMDEDNAAYLRQASSDALLGGEIGAIGSVLGAAGGAIKGMG